MTCKVCGRKGPGPRYTVCYRLERGVVWERLCWGCKVWAETGYVMPERRH